MRSLLLAPFAAALGLACTGTQSEAGGPGDSGSSGGGSTIGSTSGDSDTTSMEPEGTTAAADSSEGGSDAGSDDGPPPEPVVLTVLDEVTFYDGYAATVDEPVPAGVIRHSNSLYATRFTAEQRDLLQTTLKIGVVIGARCDNYDRIGAVNLALVPKGAETYVPAESDRLELARFITPFMDMNDSPMTVPYELEASSVLPILQDEALWAEYDLWFELYVFGVPYAANTEVVGCRGRNDTQAGTLLLYSDSAEPAEAFDVLVPLAILQPFNNYTEGASDELGSTRKTIAFDLAADAEQAQIVLITSNHGANANGEEYIRRDHFVYVDGELALEYKPGRTSCEPFRMYNTQANGIYGPSPKTDEEWQSFSNWCPGDVIDIRIVPFGPAAAGAHELVIDVPDATFAGAQGDFPLSAYVQAR